MYEYTCPFALGYPMGNLRVDHGDDDFANEYDVDDNDDNDDFFF